MALTKMRCVLAATLLIPSLIAGAQGLGIAAAMTGAGYPMSYAPKDLPEDYKAAEIATSQSLDLFSGYFSLGFLSSSSGAVDSPALNLYEALKMTWTKGETVMIDGHSFLVTYKLDADPIKLAASRSLGSTGASDAAMTLHLIRTDSIIQIEPEPTYTKAKLLAAVGATLGAQVSSSLKTRAISNMKQLALAALMYAGDWDDTMPRVQGTAEVQKLIEPYHKNSDLVRELNPNGGQIRFNMAISGVSFSAVEKVAETPMFYDSKQWPDGSRMVAFTDGHVRSIPRDQWAQIEQALKWRFKRRKT